MSAAIYSLRQLLSVLSSHNLSLPCNSNACTACAAERQREHAQDFAELLQIRLLLETLEGCTTIVDSGLMTFQHV